MTARDEPGALEERFSALWATLEPIGRDAGTGGYRRFAWTATGRTLRDWFTAEAALRGMPVETDRNGNLWAWDGEPDDGAVVTGSHLDSVPDGGAFDGPLGVVSALLAVDVLRARNAGTRRRPVAVVVFADEEGARFGVACAGSRLLTGTLDPDVARRLTDRDGIRLGDALRAADVDPDGLGRDERALARVGAYVELHVEQGRALAELGAPVAVATAIVPHGRWRLGLRGAADHAGTTRLPDRHDPMLPFAAAVLAAREVAAREHAVATIGRVEVGPNATNAVPSSVDAWLDARAADDKALETIVEGVVAAARAAAGPGVAVTCTPESRSPAVTFDVPLRDRIRAVLGGVPLLPTAAGHDAGVLAAAVPAAMLFVRNPTGVSHSPAERAEVADCVAGIEALAAVLEELACR